MDEYDLRFLYLCEVYDRSWNDSQEDVCYIHQFTELSVGYLCPVVYGRYNALLVC